MNIIGSGIGVNVFGKASGKLYLKKSYISSGKEKREFVLGFSKSSNEYITCMEKFNINNEKEVIIGTNKGSLYSINLEKSISLRKYTLLY